jgi:hypothetical protein
VTPNAGSAHAPNQAPEILMLSEGKTTEKGLREFLILLSICETCKYKSVDFLDFLRSDSKDVDDFLISGRKQRLLSGN